MEPDASFPVCALVSGSVPRSTMVAPAQASAPAPPSVAAPTRGEVLPDEPPSLGAEQTEIFRAADPVIFGDASVEMALAPAAEKRCSLEGVASADPEALAPAGARVDVVLQLQHNVDMLDMQQQPAAPPAGWPSRGGRKGGNPGRGRGGRGQRGSWRTAATPTAIEQPHQDGELD